jgi:RimJ/RimL family protein N-acetyltransferase
MIACRIKTDRLLVRCYSPEDASKLKEAVDASLDHLRPWMSWAKDEPTELDTKVELLRRFRGNFDLGTDFVYGIFSADGSVVLGGTGFHPRVGPNALEIGYWIREDSIGKGFATATLRRRATRWQRTRLHDLEPLRDRLWCERSLASPRHGIRRGTTAAVLNSARRTVRRGRGRKRMN